MILWSILILMVTASSNQIVLFITRVTITNSFSIVASTCIIKMVYMNGLSAWSLKCPVTWCFTHIFSVKIILVQTCVQWILVMPPIITITCLIMRTLLLLISSQELHFSITILKIFEFEVFLSTSWIPRFNKVINSHNGSHYLIAGSSLNSVYIIEVLFLWYSIHILSISPHNFIWSLVIISEQSSLFILRKNLLLSEINLSLMVFSTWWILIIMIRLI